MSALVIKNLPEHLHAQLKLQAKRNHRSLTKEAIALIEAGVGLATAQHRPGNDIDPLDSVFAAGDQLAEQGVDAMHWAARSREVWR